MNTVFKYLGLLFLPGLLLTVAGCDEGSKDSSTAASAAPTPAKLSAASTKESELAAKAKWDKKNIDALANGNLPIAIGLVKPLSIQDIQQKAKTVDDISDLVKTPSKHYGEFLKLSGTADFVTNYPPGSTIAKLFGKGTISEIVLTSEGGSELDFFILGSAGSTKVGDQLDMYGMPIGLSEVASNLGGTVTHLILVAKK